MSAGKPEWFDASPSAERAAACHGLYRQLMLSQLDHAIAQCAEGLKTDLSHVTKALKGLGEGKGVSPALYAAFSGLDAVMKMGNVTRVMDEVQAIRSAPEAYFQDTSFRVDSIMSEAWEKELILSTRVEEEQGAAHEQHIMRPILRDDILDANREEVELALSVLKEADPEMEAEFREYVCRVKLFHGIGYRGFSSPAAFGAVFVKIPERQPQVHYLEYLIDELSQLVLNVLPLFDPILKNGMEPCKSPFNEKPCPVFEVFRATYALGRNVRVFRKLAEKTPFEGWEAVCRRVEESYGKGHECLRDNGQFTDLGGALFESMEKVD